MGSLDRKLAKVRKYKNFPVILWEDGIVDVNNPRAILDVLKRT